jgi:hypothetical protein
MFIAANFFFFAKKGKTSLSKMDFFIKIYLNIFFSQTKKPPLIQFSFF